MAKLALNKTAECNSVETSETVLWDELVKGLGLRKRGTSVSWVVQWRERGRTRKTTLGRKEEVPLSLAREMARALLDQVEASAKPEHLPCVTAFGAHWLDDQTHSWKPATRKANRYCVNNCITPYLGTKRIDRVSRDDVTQWMETLPQGPGSRNRSMAVLSGMMRHAELLGCRKTDSNPCKGLRRATSNFKANYMTDRQWSQFGMALKALEDSYPQEVGCLRFLVLTGCRKGEALGMRWSMIEGARCMLPDAKAGPRTVWIGKPARRLLASYSRANSFVFGEGLCPLPGHWLDKVWHIVRRNAALSGFRLHDLRHSFASVAINAGLDLRVVGGLLGHKDSNTTKGYAHLDMKSVRTASQRVGSHLLAIVKKGQGKKSVDNIYERFRRSRLLMAEFCKANDLEEKAFHAGMVAWRKTLQQRGIKNGIKRGARP